MTDHAINTSPQVYARIGGALYLIIITFGLFAEGFVNNTLIVAGDAAATASNIMASQSLWRLSVAGNILVPMCAVALLLIEYVLLRPVSKVLVLLAVFFNLVSLGVEAVSKVYLLEMVSILGDAPYAKVFAPEQLQALAYLSLKSHDIAWNIALLFFGCTCLVNGYLIFKSGYLPKTIGILMQIAGVSYLTACSAALLAPGVAAVILPTILLPVFIGETSLCLWLIVKGVNVPKWNMRVNMEVASGA